MARKKKADKAETEALEEENLREDETPVVESSYEPEAQPEMGFEPKLEKPMAQPKPEPASPPPDESQTQKPLVSLEVFLKVAGPKWDQLAGFKHYAKKNELGPLTVQEWRAALQSFMKRPTR